MKDFMLRCIMDLKTEWNPGPGIQSRTSYKYRNVIINLETNRFSSPTFKCPSCGSTVKLDIYPALNFKESFRMMWKLHPFLSVFKIITGIFILLLFTIPDGFLNPIVYLIVFLWFRYFVLREIMNYRKLNIKVDKTYQHLLLYNKKKSFLFGEKIVCHDGADLKERASFYNYVPII